MHLSDFSGASHAVDDKYTTRKRFGGACVESEYGHKSATWRVDLGVVFNIHHIVIQYMDLGSPNHYIWSRLSNMFSHSVNCGKLALKYKNSGFRFNIVTKTIFFQHKYM